MSGNTAANTPIIFKSQVYFSGDSVGQAKILAGATSVRITFSKPYEQQPIVTMSSLDRFVPAFVKDVDATGFTIALDESYTAYTSNLQPLTSDFQFNWHAFASPEAKLTVSDGTLQDVVLVVPTPIAPLTPEIVVNGGGGSDGANGENTNGVVAEPTNTETNEVNETNNETTAETPAQQTAEQTPPSSDAGLVAGDSTSAATPPPPPATEPAP